MKRITQYTILALCLVLLPMLAWAGQTTGSVGIGIQGVDIDDSREGAAEYLTADQGGNATFDMNVNGYQRGIKYDVDASYLDEDDLGGRLDMDVKRYFRTKNSYQKFIHWLENDDLVNYNEDPDFVSIGCKMTTSTLTYGPGLLISLTLFHPIFSVNLNKLGSGN